MKRLLALPLILITLSGCAQNISPDTYSVGSVGQANRTVRGTIIHARPVNVQGSQSGTGAVAGGLGGGLAGSSIGGGGRANAIGAIGGAVVGGIAGAAVEEGVTKQTAMEYVVDTENDNLITVVQGQDVNLHKGTKVLVIYGNPTRIIRDN
jgi:outer membrane lipoprotein SlyB